MKRFRGGNNRSMGSDIISLVEMDITGVWCITVSYVLDNFYEF